MKEVIFIGMPGPTHSYGGLSIDNVAAMTNQGGVSHPKEAALQSLELARTLENLGLTVGILPPQLRPHLGLLHSKFSGDAEKIIPLAAEKDPELLDKASTSSAMWVANAATVAPSLDTHDGKLHITTANLHSHLHRRIEAEDTHRVLAAIFSDRHFFTAHAPLPAKQGFRDEGAANHTRLAPYHGAKGLHIFVYGTDGDKNDPATARQNLLASKKLHELHQLPDSQTIFIKQNPDVIRQGIFHNDVISVGNENVLLYHEHAFARGKEDIVAITRAYHTLHPGEKLHLLEIPEAKLSVADAVKTYFFNSQIVTKPDGTMVIIAPQEVQEHGASKRLMDEIIAGANPINDVLYLDLRQSMKNGGGPACLRLRVLMREEEIASVQKNSHALLDATLLAQLEKWIATYYPEALTRAELANPALYHNSKKALTELASMLSLPVMEPTLSRPPRT